MKTHSEQFILFLKKYLFHNPDALLWVLSYVSYAHAIDSIIDQDEDFELNDKLFIVKTFEFSAAIYSNHFYIQNMHMLYPIVKTSANSYMNSLEYEDSPINWKRQLGDALRS